MAPTARWTRAIRALGCGLVLACAVCAGAQSANQGGKRVLGKLGQTLKTASIHASASSRARVYYRLKPYEYLVVKPSQYSGWHQVLLQNGRYGYIKSAYIAELPYDVSQPVQTASKNAPPAQRVPGSATSRAAAAEYGTRFAGTPYVWGGNDPMRGIDCSGFVKYLYGKIGINLPRTAAQQALVGTPITRLEDLQKGDRLYFWDKKRGKIGHTGLYLGNGYFVHSSSGKGGVSTDYLGSPKWLGMLVAARR